MSETRTVTLAREQIDFILESLDYAAQHFRNHDFGPGMDEVAKKRRAEVEASIANIRAVLTDAEG